MSTREVLYADALFAALVEQAIAEAVPSDLVDLEDLPLRLSSRRAAYSYRNARSHASPSKVIK